MNSVLKSAAPLLSQEGWREAPGWFRSEIPRECGFGTTPRVIASQSRCPPNLGGQREFLALIQFTHSFIDRPCNNERWRKKLRLSTSGNVHSRMIERDFIGRMEPHVRNSYFCLKESSCPKYCQ